MRDKVLGRDAAWERCCVGEGWHLQKAERCLGSSEDKALWSAIIT